MFCNSVAFILWTSQRSLVVSPLITCHFGLNIRRQRFFKSSVSVWRQMINGNISSAAQLINNGFDLILFKMPCFANSELLEVLRFVHNSKTFTYFLNRNALEQVWLVWRETVKRFRRQCVCNYLPVNWTSWSTRNFALNSYNSEQEFLNLVPALAVVMMPCDIPKSMHVKFYFRFNLYLMYIFIFIFIFI